jgi:C-terminal processing protease CtpA/Prc
VAELDIVKRMRSASMFVLTLLFAAVANLGCALEKPGSIGAHLSRDNESGAVYVRDLFPGLAGEKAGLLPGDEIIMIDGHYVRQMNAPRIREALRGQVGTAVRLTLIRGELVLRVKVARSELRSVQDEQPKPRVETLKE